MSQKLPPDKPEPQAESRIGTLVGQRYKVLSMLGEGGIGTVYLADDTATGTQVALKMLRREVASEPEIVARFDREAKAMTALAHEHIVQALNFGRTPEGDICLVMELVQGETLRNTLRRTGPFPAHGLVQISRQIASALTRAHSMGIVHRDLKPENVMVSWRPDGSPWIKVLDFGMARLLVGASVAPMTQKGVVVDLTRKGAVFGTPEYMPPEQAMGQPVDARADQYAFGVIIFEMISGRRPFLSKTALEMVQAQIRHSPPSLTDLVPGLSPAVAAVVARMLAKRPDKRYPDVQSAISALSDVVFPGSGDPSATRP
jgi:serine/threonine-protein kinase